MAQRVTIQDIADELGLSRNTVSKAINNTGVLADATRERILKKAAEMGYRQLSFTASPSADSLPSPAAKEKDCIALFSSVFLGNSHFSSLMLDKFQAEISRLGYSLTMYRVLPEEIRNLRLPSSFQKEKTAGILCIEMFDYEYCRMLCDLGIALLFADTPATGLREPLKADCLYMDNQSHILTFVNEMVRRGKTRIGFIGDHLHCQSFFERYLAFRNAMLLLELDCPEQYCITNSHWDSSMPADNYQEYLLRSIEALDELPQVFICANDFIAIDVLKILKELDISVPEDVYLCGFDDSMESRLVTPALTTIHIHTQIMGVAAAQLLLSRIEQPSLDYRAMHTETDLIYRASTED